MRISDFFSEYRDKHPLYHYVVSSWIRSNPGTFIDIMKRYKDWIWLKGKPVFVQMEWRHPNTLMFYDVYMKVWAPYRNIPNKFRYYHVFIEIKTGKYNDNWVTQLRKQYHNRKSSKLGTRFDDYPQLLFIAKKSEISKLKQELGSYPTGFLLFFELDYIKPYIQRDLKSLLYKKLS
ncbi:hypothetical protein AVU39_gp35 [Sulfolobus monocaudavirus SMV2]|uniref:hypothetical protein n=1 Tax=Sulfolobus monocaudavirus SMV2 TaxID=1580591 RepID=UPI0006D2FBD3|nr:hypothetical protein AVU39_gp35 [Sulfolobus monocaudavirus SMV2]AIZ11369.1 hypothetical protein [Sulfolobus monocaudavirus SMV2]